MGSDQIMFTDYGKLYDTRGGRCSQSKPPNLHPFHPPALIRYLHDEIRQQSHDRWKLSGQITINK